MKYIGYILFSLIFIGVFFLPSAKDFYIASYELAPEITLLVSFCYLYIVLLTIILSLFPKLLTDRLSLYDNHIKMTCSVMVSLGLVGTFLGLVEMISGIGAALSGGETDFAKKMESLLGAISTSLGAMSFAFMTSILGVGISAYSLVAATFVSSSFSEDKKKQLKKESAGIKNDPYTNLVSPILDRIQTLEEKETVEGNHIKFEETTFDNLILERMKKLESAVQNIDISRFEKDFTPLFVIDTITQHHQLLEKHNEILTSSILQLSRHNLSLTQSLDNLSATIIATSENLGEKYKSLTNLNETMLKNNAILRDIDNSAQEFKNKTNTLFDKFKRLFD